MFRSCEAARLHACRVSFMPHDWAFQTYTREYTVVVLLVQAAHGMTVISSSLLALTVQNEKHEFASSRGSLTANDCNCSSMNYTVA